MAVTRSLWLHTIALSAGLMACSPEAAGPSATADQTEALPPAGSNPRPLPSRPAGIWIDYDVLAALPSGGAGWASLEGQARQPCGRIDLADQDSSANICVLAKALVFRRLGTVSFQTDVLAALNEVAAAPYHGRALSLGRELAAYVIAADVIDLPHTDPALDQRFRTAIAALLTVPTSEGPHHLVDCHETRPNNWGTNCGASRAAVLSYLRDTAGLARVAQVLRGWLGDRSAYSGFKFGDLSWQCEPSAPVSINPAGCQRSGHSIDGVLPDDQRRAGPFAWPPPKENYVYEALQGAVVQAVILTQAGYPAFEWENQALLRAFKWLYSAADYPAGGDDTWIVPLINHYYGATYAVSAGRPGKVMAWTEWTHGR
jgi:hypothetical protein